MRATRKPTKYSMLGAFTASGQLICKTERNKTVQCSPLIFRISIKFRSLYRLRLTVTTKILHRHTAKFKQKYAGQLKTLQFAKHVTSSYETY